MVQDTTQRDEDRRAISSTSTALEAQRRKILALLRTSPKHTYQLRALGISHPAGRVLELQRMGYDIQTERISTVDGDGYMHHGVARYTLNAEPQEVNHA